MKHILLAFAGVLLFVGVTIAFLPFRTDGVARSSEELVFQEFSCPNPVAATVDIAGTPYWQLFDDEVPACTYKAGARLILATLLFGMAGSLLVAHICIRVHSRTAAPDPGPYGGGAR